MPRSKHSVGQVQARCRAEGRERAALKRERHGRSPGFIRNGRRAPDSEEREDDQTVTRGRGEWPIQFGSQCSGCAVTRVGRGLMFGRGVTCVTLDGSSLSIVHMPTRATSVGRPPARVHCLLATEVGRTTGTAQVRPASVRMRRMWIPRHSGRRGRAPEPAISPAGGGLVPTATLLVLRCSPRLRARATGGETARTTLSALVRRRRATKVHHHPLFTARHVLIPDILQPISSD
jgi:hypothetical protein